MITLTKILIIFINLIDFFLKNFFRRAYFKNLIYDNLRQNYIVKKIKNKKIKFFIPSKASKYRVDKFFVKEPETIKFIEKYSKQKVFFDIGANIGLFTLFASSLNKHTNVFAFEPSGSNLGILNRNVSINNLEKKITIIPFPLSQKKHSINIISESYLYEGGSQISFGKAVNDKGNFFLPLTKYKTIAFSLDYLTNNKILPCPNFIKLDVDGNEFEILCGAKKILKNRTLKALIVEINLKSKNYNKISKLLKQYGFFQTNYLSHEKIISNVIFERN